MKNLCLEGRIWLSLEGESFLGSGKSDLVCKIEELGSLRKAAQEMKMSYRKAWYSIKKLNELAGEPIIILQRGGKNGGEAIVTEKGKAVIESFRQLQQEFDLFLAEKKNLFG